MGLRKKLESDAERLDESDIDIDKTPVKALLFFYYYPILL